MLSSRFKIIGLAALALGLTVFWCCTKKEVATSYTTARNAALILVEADIEKTFGDDGLEAALLKVEKYVGILTKMKDIRTNPTYTARLSALQGLYDQLEAELSLDPEIAAKLEDARPYLRVIAGLADAQLGDGETLDLAQEMDYREDWGAPLMARLRRMGSEQ